MSALAFELFGVGWAAVAMGEVRSTFERALERLLTSPSVDGGVVPGEQHVWHAATPKNPRPCVVRVIETTPGLEGILHCGFVVPKHTRDQAGDRLNHC